MTDSTEAALAARLSGYRERGVQRIKIAFTDVDGVMRAKYVSLDKFAGLLGAGGGWCDCVFGWDVDDVLYEQGTFTGWHSGFPDARYWLRLETERWLDDEACPLFLADFAVANPDCEGEPPPCPRALLQRVLTRLDALGLTLRAGFEYEFFVFAETAHSVRDKGYRGLTPLSPGNFGYSMLRTGEHSQLFGDYMAHCAAMQCDLEGLHTETGPGVWEAALAPHNGLEAADRAALLKSLTKIFFSRRDLLATFMAKWSMDVPGQSGHFHFSFVDGAGVNQFADPAAQHGMSSLQRHALAGVHTLLPQWLAMLAPTINSYTRLVKGAWAPTAATWGVENRTAALRVIASSSAQRIECRIPGADANPYLVAAAVVAAAIAGIEQAMSLPEAVQGNAYALQEQLPEQQQFATTLSAATAQLRASAQARDAFGEHWVEHFAMSRDWESQEYQRHLNSWQLERYFEII
ncbi:MAG: glutamine synthetase family protein [Pseudomonadales bacterium]